MESHPRGYHLMKLLKWWRKVRIAYRKILGAQLNPFRRQRTNLYKVKTLLHSNQCKVLMKPDFFKIILFERALKMMKNGVYFIVIALLVTNLFNLCKLDDLWHHNVDTKWCKTTKKWLSLAYFSLENWNLVQLYTHHKVPWYVHCDMATQWAPGPLHSKGKMKFFLLQEVLFALFVHSVSLNFKTMN